MNLNRKVCYCSLPTKHVWGNYWFRTVASDFVREMYFILSFQETFVLMDTTAMIPWIDNMGSLSHRCKALIIMHLAISILTSNFVVLCKVCYHFGPIHFLSILSPNLADIFFITFST